MQKYHRTIEFIENGKYLLLTQFGEINLADAEDSLLDVMRHLDRVHHVTHFIADMTKAMILPDTQKLIDSRILKKLHEHPFLGLQTIILPTAVQDPLVYSTLSKYETRLIKENILAKGMEFRRHVAQFSSLKEVITFLRIYDETWDIPRSEENEFPKYCSLIESGQIMLVKPIGDIDMKMAEQIMEEHIFFLDRSPHILHNIADMTECNFLPESAGIMTAEITRKALNHPKLGFQTMVQKTKKADQALSTVMKAFNIMVIKDNIMSPDGEFKRKSIDFNSVDEAKTFLLTFNKMWNPLR